MHATNAGEPLMQKVTRSPSAKAIQRLADLFDRRRQPPARKAVHKRAVLQK
jgi:hypothetical protein